jgi:hypothetical protein
LVYYKAVQRCKVIAGHWILRASKGQLLRSCLHGVSINGIPPLSLLTAVSVIFALHLILSIHSMLFAPERNPEDEENMMESKGKEVDREWEMVPVPATPGTPFGRMPMSPMTPRTKAFQALEGDSRRLSFRQSYPEPPPLSFPPPPTKAKKGKK